MYGSCLCWFQSICRLGFLTVRLLGFLLVNGFYRFQQVIAFRTLSLKGLRLTSLKLGFDVLDIFFFLYAWLMQVLKLEGLDRLCAFGAWQVSGGCGRQFWFGEGFEG